RPEPARRRLQHAPVGVDPARRRTRPRVALSAARCAVRTRVRFSSVRRGPRSAVVAAETKSARTRRRILDAAAEVFSEQGYGARLSDIAERAEMKTGSLYYHFVSREDLVGEVLRLGIDGAWEQVADAVDRLPSTATATERLAAAIRAHTM